MASLTACYTDDYNGGEGPDSPSSSQGSCSLAEVFVQTVVESVRVPQLETMAFPARIPHAPIVDGRYQDQDGYELVSFLLNSVIY